MKVKLTYFRQDGRKHASVEYESAQTSFAAVVAEVYANSRQQGKSAGLTGRADCYHIIVNAKGQNAVLSAAALRHASARSRRARIHSVKNLKARFANDLAAETAALVQSAAV